MRIDPNLVPGAGGQADRVKDAHKSGGQTSGAAKAGHAAGAGDTVSLSSTHSEVQQLKAAIANVPEVRAQRVAELKQKVESKSYQPSNAKVADAVANEYSTRKGRR
jgi:flagellar biosynthesis anti-sigma factor FlgM